MPDSHVSKKKTKPTNLQEIKQAFVLCIKLFGIFGIIILVMNLVLGEKTTDYIFAILDKLSWLLIIAVIPLYLKLKFFESLRQMKSRNALIGFLLGTIVSGIMFFIFAVVFLK